jgi:hypothetical protein
VPNCSGPDGRRQLSLPLAALGALVVAAVVLRAVAALALPTPFLYPDEGVYALLGRGLWRHGDLAVLGGPSRYVSTLYPVVSALPYGLLRVLQVLALCGSAVVAYVWARRLARPAWALAAAALTLALPGLVYAGTIVADALFVPLATLAGLLGIEALDRPTPRRQAFLVAALAASALTSGEANVLVLALLAAAAATRRVRALWPTWLAVAAGCAVWAGLGAGSPLPAIGGLGSGGYTVHRVVVWVLEHVGDVLLVGGFVPVCAVVLLALRRRLELRLRATVVYALALALVAAVEAGVFAAGHADALLERALVYALPPLFVGFAAWLERGAPRRLAHALPVVAVGVAVVLAMPYGRLATGAAAAANPSLVPLSHLDSPKVYGVVALFAVVAAVLTLALPVARIWLLPVLLAAVLTATAVSAAEEFVDRSQALRTSLTARTPSWIETSGRGPATYLYDGVDDYRLVWSQLFWNERIAHVIDLPATYVPGPLGQRQLQLVPDDGMLRLVGGGRPQTALVVAPQGFHFRGTLLAHAARVGLSLWHVQSPPRLRTWLQGVQRNGDLLQGGVATLDVFDCGRGTFHVVAIGRDNETLRLARDGTPVTSTSLWPQGVWEQSLSTPAEPPGRRCTFSLTSSSLVHLATFTWTPR